MSGLPKVITVVCTGNICRSPMGERLLKHALEAEDEPLRSIEVRSAGVSAFAGDPPSRNAVKAMQSVKLDLSDHRSRPFSIQLAEDSDLILTMTSGHTAAIGHRFPELETPVYRFREWFDNRDPEVPDPFGGPLNLYVETRDILAEAIPSIIRYLKSLI